MVSLKKVDEKNMIQSLKECDCLFWSPIGIVIMIQEYPKFHALTWMLFHEVHIVTEQSHEWRLLSTTLVETLVREL